MDRHGSEGPPGPRSDDPPDRRRAVRDAFDRIAPHFAETRASPWPEVEAFLADAPRGRVGLDLGCANGRHVAPLARRVARVVGVDVSRPLLGEARRGARERDVDLALVQGDAGALPLAAGAVDLAVYVATLHHLPDRGARVASLDELDRVLAAGGRALVSAWSVAHERFDRERGFDTTVDWTLPDGETVPRFYHIYDPDEFAADLAASDLEVIEAFVSSGNCYASVRSSG